MCTLCGIPAIELLGSEDDWVHLGEKLRTLQKILAPVTNEIGLPQQWWSLAEKVFDKLLKTYQGSLFTIIIRFEVLCRQILSNILLIALGRSVKIVYGSRALMRGGGVQVHVHPYFKRNWWART